MELLQMSAFVSLAQTQHMPLTAQELNTTQSHISKLVSSLEAELGVKLFDRVGRGIILNEHGKLFFEYASGALQLMQDGQSALKKVSRSVLGTVKIGCYAFTPIIHPCIKAFALQNPMVDFHFSEVQQQNANVLMNTADLVLAATRGETYTMQSYFPVHRALIEEAFYVVISPKLACFPPQKSSIRMDEICHFPMVEVAPSPFYQNWVFRSEDTQKMQDVLGVTLHVGYTANDFYSKISILDQGLGFALLPEVCIAAALRIAPDLQVLHIEDYPIRRKILIARKHRNQMSAAALSFWTFILNYYHLPPDKGEKHAP